MSVSPDSFCTSVTIYDIILSQSKGVTDMARVAIDLFRPFSREFKRSFYEAAYDIVNEVHYENEPDARAVGDVSVIVSTPENLSLGIEPDFDIELMIMEGSDNWPNIEGVLLGHDEAKVILDDRAKRISDALKELFPAPSHAVMENAQGTGWATYNGNYDLIVPADFDTTVLSPVKP